MRSGNPRIKAYRIADSRFPVFDGTGAALYGGRWSSPGRRVIYGSLSYATAMLELLVHAGIGTVPRHQVAVEFFVPDEVDIEEVVPEDVPGWDLSDQTTSRVYGDLWLCTRRTCALVVPSAVSRRDRNVLISQDHPDFSRITVSEPEPVVWNGRLFTRP